MPPIDQQMPTWVPAASAVLNQHPPAEGLSRTRNRLTSAKGQAKRTARATAGLPAAAASGVKPRLSTIHQVKGDQAEAVLLLIPGGRMTERTGPVLSAWLSGAAPDAEIAEALRVAYVGVTRAQRLLGLAAPTPYRDRISAFLRRYGVPTELR